MNPSPYQNSADYSRIQSLHIHLMSAYCVSHTISDHGDTAANERDKVCVLKKLIPMQVFLPIREINPLPRAQVSTAIQLCSPLFGCSRYFRVSSPFQQVVFPSSIPCTSSSSGPAPRGLS